MSALPGETENTVFGVLFGGMAAGMIGLLLAHEPVAAVMGGGLAGFLTFRKMTGRFRRRRWIRKQPFPAKWTAILEKDVPLIRVLEPEHRTRFEQRMKVFLDEKRITGVGVTLTERMKVLTAASAVIPVLGLPSWEYDELGEVLIYGSTFSQEFEQGGPKAQILGMVGEGVMDRMMILSWPDLERGFRHPTDRNHVGLHEFAHLIDKADGLIDGVPAAVLDRRQVEKWKALMADEMERLERGDSILDRYGLKNEAEFFAVCTEAYFERPDELHEHHPELWEMLRKVFRLDLRSRLKTALHAAFNITTRLPKRAKCPCGSGKTYGVCCGLDSKKKGKLGRNDPCPCGSGRKYKKCCL